VARCPSLAWVGHAGHQNVVAGREQPIGRSPRVGASGSIVDRRGARAEFAQRARSSEECGRLSREAGSGACIALGCSNRGQYRCSLLGVWLGSRQSTTNMLLGMDDSTSATADPGPQGRCVCGAKVTIADAREVTLPNGRAGWQGYCPECGAPLFAIRRGSGASS